MAGNRNRLRQYEKKGTEGNAEFLGRGVGSVDNRQTDGHLFGPPYASSASPDTTSVASALEVLLRGQTRPNPAFHGPCGRGFGCPRGGAGGYGLAGHPEGLVHACDRRPDDEAQGERSVVVIERGPAAAGDVCIGDSTGINETGNR